MDISNTSTNNEIPIKVENKNYAENLFDIKYILNIFRRRKKLFFFTTFFSFSTFILLLGLHRLINPTYIGLFQILINDPITKKYNTEDSLGTKPFAVFDFVAKNENVSNDIPTLIEYLKSESVLDNILRKYKIDYYSIVKNLQVFVKDKSTTFDTDPQILNVTFQNKNPKLGLEILKNLANTYLDASLKLKQKRLNEGLQFLDSQEPKLKNQSESLRKEIAIFREKNNLLDPKEEAKNLKNRLNKLDDQILKLKSEQARLEIIEDEVKKGNLVSSGLEISENEGKLTGGLGLFITDSNQNILKELVELKKLYAEYLTKYLPSSDLVKGIEQRIIYLEPIVLKKQLDSVKSALELKNGTIVALTRQRDELNKVFLKQPKYISEYQILEDQLKLALEKEEALIKARENFQIEINQNTIPWTIIRKPNFERKPIDYRRFLFLGFLGSGLLGFLLIFFRDLSENVFYDSKSIESYFNQNVISNIPFFRNISDNKTFEASKIESYINYNFQNNEEEIKNYDNSFYQEIIRDLYTNLTLNFSERKLKTIAITSSISNEGKTLISCLIAKVFSQNNYKVLLVDANLREPTVHLKFDIQNKSGLTNLLSDGNLQFEEFINELDPNLFVITSGSANYDSIKLLGSKNLNKFFDAIKDSNKFDLVIFDTAPILAFSDYKWICKNTDGLIFLIGLRFSKKYLLDLAFKEVKKLKSNILGIISNTTDLSNISLEVNRVDNRIDTNNENFQIKEFFLKLNNNKRFTVYFGYIKSFFEWLDK